MKFHVLGLAHTKTNLDFIACAFTMKIYNMCSMLKDLGHEVIHYGNQGSNPVCDENVVILNKKEFRDNYADNLLHYKGYSFDKEEYGWQQFNFLVKEKLSSRIKDRKKEFILSFFGNYQQEIEQAKLGVFVEAGIGYDGFFAKYKVFESYYWMATCLARTQGSGMTGDFFSIVIPNYFDLDMFKYKEKKSKYYLFMGRLIKRKGIEIIKQLSKVMKIKIKVVGAGDTDLLELENHQNIDYVGMADVHERKRLLRNAKALIAPTLYIEPFGGVVVEAMLSGTPVITTDWGGFTETVLHGITGYRCRSFHDFMEAIRKIDEIDPKNCREWGKNYSKDKIKYMYENYFLKLYDYENGKEWLDFGENIEDKLSWLNKDYPNLN